MRFKRNAGTRTRKSPLRVCVDQFCGWDEIWKYDHLYNLSLADYKDGADGLQFMETLEEESSVAVKKEPNRVWCAGTVDIYI